MQDTRTAQFTQLQHYISRGWALVPLHDVSAGHCSCRLGSACRSAGKHPRGEEWQRPDNLVRDETGLWRTLEAWPACNWGLATGLISGVWALDYDPKSVDPAQLAEVQAVLDACWAAATWVQKTGSGGLHFVFALPEDFVPNNGSGGLPKGFDVRGARRGEVGGGQIVLAPSVSGVGAYEVLADRPVTAAPPGVLDAVRPAPPRAAAPLTTFTAAAADKIGAYLTAAINGELAELRATWTNRNQRAWRAAARCIELVNTGMVNGEAAYAAWWAAAQAHPDLSVTVPDVELLRVWASAERHVGDRPADLSSVGGAAGWWGGDVISFPSAPGAAPPLLGGGPDPGAGNGMGQYPQGVHNPVDNGAPPDDPVAALIARMLTAEQLDERPNPVPLINGVLDCATTAWLIGKSGSCKSFLALDIAAHVGLGREWRERKVTQGLVVYIVAEGDQGMKLRQAAWRREYGPIKDVLFLPEPVQADERRAGPQGGAWSILVEACRRLNPVLVIIDTQARVTIGLNENDNGDMSYYAEQADRIKRACGACVLTVHHLGRSGGDARGASALDGAQDAELKVERDDMRIKLIMDKQKDQAELPPVSIGLRLSLAEPDPETGRDLSSLVLDHTEVPTLSEPGERLGRQEVGRRRALAMYQEIVSALGEGYPGEGLTRSRIESLFKALPEIASLPRASDRNAATVAAWALLLSRGRVMRFGTSQRFAVFAPPDGAADGLLTMNTGGREDEPPMGWSLHWPKAEWVDWTGKSRDVHWLGDEA